jgi:hypothetical protein
MPKQMMNIANLTVKPSRSRNDRKVSESIGGIFHPWFLPRSTYQSIVRLVPREYLMKMRDYFERYGCIRCEKRQAGYGQNGMCRLCYSEIGRRLRRCLKARFRQPKMQTGNREVTEIIAGAKMARKLLRDMMPATRGTANAGQQKYNTRNPTTGIRA